ncbi:MAG TPA: methyl-accepting chemotaxis protein [Anaeromyxobacteraceae bacterium]
MAAYSHLGFKQKLLLLPVTATVALLAVAATYQVLAGRTNAVLHELETRLVPAVALSRDLQDLLERLQRSLQDGVAAEDREALADTARVRDAFLARLEEGGETDADANLAGAIEQEFKAYFTVAVRASEALIARAPGDVLLRETVTRYQAVRGLLARRSADERERLAQGFDEVRRLQRLQGLSMGLGTVAAVLLVGLLAAWAASSVARPVLALARAAKRVADGDLTQELQVDSNDELGELARAFAVMVDKLRVVPTSLRASVEELSTAVQDVATASGEQGAVLERQQAGLARSRNSAERIQRESQETSRRAEAVLRMAGQVEAFGDAAQIAARETLTGLSEIGEQVRAMTGGISRVDHHTHVVRELVAAMKRLATESGELALSVSVESARAGAAGGPLADSARQLKDVASRLVQAGARVGKALSEVEGAVAGVGALSDDSKRRMERGLEQIRISGESLREITAVVQKSARAARAIVTSVSEQGHAIAEITSNVLDLDKAMGDALRGNRAAERSAEALKRTANSIAGVVRAFRV